MRATRKSFSRKTLLSVQVIWLAVIVGLFVYSAVLLTTHQNRYQGKEIYLSKRPSLSKSPHRSPSPHHATKIPSNFTSTNRKSDKEKTPRHIEPPKQVPQSTKPNVSLLLKTGEISHGDRTSTKIAVTFDAGGDAQPLEKILETLAKHKVHCTFFLTGQWIKRNPLLVKKIALEGHEIGNHTYSHKRLSELSDSEIVDEIAKTEQLVLELTGRSTKPLLRVPYGARDKRVLDIISQEGYYSVYWDIDSWDSVKKDITSKEIMQRILSKVQNGSIILMHCGSRASAEALDPLLTDLLNSGYQPVTVSELLFN
jgi:peptidoglycan/xylan/chitin deacetylase (PgdA/CDA1 family)